MPHCPDHLRFVGNRIVDGDVVLDTPEERDVFRALGLEWLDPTKR